MARRRSAPVTVLHAADESRETRAVRAAMMQELRRLEWQFDKRADLKTVRRIRDLRMEISELEFEILEATITQRARSTREKVSALLEGGEGGDTAA